MNNFKIQNRPPILPQIKAKCKEYGFTMASDNYTGSLLKTLVASKPKSLLLELGTGIGFSLSWMIEGMDKESKLITLDNDPKLIEFAKENFGKNKQVEIICIDGNDWLNAYKNNKFDLVFADAWPGKYSNIEKALDLIKVGGLYIIDDMLPQPNWEDGHQENVDELIVYLDSRKDFSITKLKWSTGIIIATRLS